MPFFLDRSGVAMIYQNFDLEVISPHGGDRLCARVLESPQGDCPFVDVKWPFDAEEENAMLAEIYGGLRQRRGRSSPASTIEDFGGRLFEAVFSGDIEHLFRSSLDSAFRSGKGLRVRLRLPEDSELHVRPWEFLFDTESREFLAVREHTPLVRYLPVAQPIPPITVEGPLRVLVALSAPTDHPRLDIAREWDILRHALGPSVAAGQLDLRRVPGRCTFDNLRDSLRHYGAHIFHFVGHGVPGALVLEQESGKGLEMEATHLRAAFPIGALPRLIVLNACSGAITEDVPFSGLAQGFLRQGVPAVVAMQASITDDAALIFTRYFYRDLIEIGAVDTSLTEARLRMQANGHPIEWGTPVLYMRALSGQLFQPAAKPATSPAASAAAQKKPKEPAAKTGTRPSRVAPALNEQKEARETQSQQGAMPLQADLAPWNEKKAEDDAGQGESATGETRPPAAGPGRRNHSVGRPGADSGPARRHAWPGLAAVFSTGPGGDAGPGRATRTLTQGPAGSGAGRSAGCRDRYRDAVAFSGQHAVHGGHTRAIDAICLRDHASASRRFEGGAAACAGDSGHPGACRACRPGSTHRFRIRRRGHTAPGRSTETAGSQASRPGCTQGPAGSQAGVSRPGRQLQQPRDQRKKRELCVP